MDNIEIKIIHHCQTKGFNKNNVPFQFSENLSIFKVLFWSFMGLLFYL